MSVLLDLARERIGWTLCCIAYPKQYRRYDQRNPEGRFRHRCCTDGTNAEYIPTNQLYQKCVICCCGVKCDLPQEKQHDTKHKKPKCKAPIKMGKNGINKPVAEQRHQRRTKKNYSGYGMSNA